MGYDKLPFHEQYTVLTVAGVLLFFT